jgi:multicomponent Na+:H+ antiporter subunit D
MSILFLLIPLVFILLLNLPSRSTAARVAPWLLALVCLSQMLLAVTSNLAVWQPLDNLLAAFVPIELTVDLISAIVLFMIALVALIANIVGFAGDARAKVITASLILVCMTGMNGIVMVRDLFSLYIFLEITAVSTFILIAIQRDLPALSGAFRYFILSGLATFAMLIASGLIFMQTDSLAFAEVAAALTTSSQAATVDGRIVSIALILYIVAFCVKAGAAPFHGWLPDAYTYASNAISVLLAGIITKVAGVYVIVRLMSDVFGGLSAPSNAFMVLGAFTIIFGAFAAIGQGEMKRMLAFSSISQMGYIILAAGLATPLAIVGAMVHFVNHALFKSLLFVNATAVVEQTESTEFADLGGLSERMPVTGWTSAIGFMSTAGIPPLSGFWSKLLIIIALATAGQLVYAIIAVMMSLVTLGYFLIMQRRVYFGKLREGLEDLREARRSLVGASLLLAALTTGLGLAFPLVMIALENGGLFI